MKNNSLTALSGVQVGHSTHVDKLTGCTFVLFDKPFPVAYKSYGGGSVTYNTELLQNGKDHYYRHGLFIAGGSLTGLQCGGVIQKALIEKKIGYKNHKIINPSISGAVVFDLGLRIAQMDPEIAYEAVENVSNKLVVNGNVGAGTGTSVGKFWYEDGVNTIASMKAGIGSARINLENGGIVCALSVVNALGNIVLPDGRILAGNRTPQNKGFLSFESYYSKMLTSSENTTISVVGINIDLKIRENYEKVAHLASHGQIRAIDPVNTSVDGDTVFVFSNKEKKQLISAKEQREIGGSLWKQIEVDIIGQAAAKAVQQSIYNACETAESVTFKDAYKGIIPSVKDY